MSQTPLKPNRKKAEAQRRYFVLETALTLFSRYGYRKTSMDDVAQAANISRQGLYFYFPNKEELFRAAVTQALDQDLAAAEQALNHSEHALSERLMLAFDFWTGRYMGPISQDIGPLLESHPEIFGPLVSEYPKRFLKLLTDSLLVEVSSDREPLAIAVAQTLMATAAGFKHQLQTRELFLERIKIAIDLMLVGLEHASAPNQASKPSKSKA